jgi:hypothetical protein
MPSNSELVPVIISVDDSHLESLDQVLNRLQRAGLKEAQIIAPKLGYIRGRIESDKIEKLKGTGIKAVSQEQVRRIAPLSGNDE